jgi:hypothetical protein
LRMKFELGAPLDYFSCSAAGKFRGRLPKTLSLVSTKWP